MTRHPRNPFVVRACAVTLAAGACTNPAPDDTAAAATVEATTTTEAYVADELDPGDELEPPFDLVAVLADDPVAVAVDFVEQSETIALATPDQIQDILTPYLHRSARDEVLGDIVRSTRENQELGLVRWRHAVLEARRQELAGGDVQVELWQVAVLTVEPARGPTRTASVWATDLLTLTETNDGWQITDRLVRSGPTPEPAPSALPDDAERLEADLDGFGDVHDQMSRRGR